MFGGLRDTFFACLFVVLLCNLVAGNEWIPVEYIDLLTLENRMEIVTGFPESYNFISQLLHASNTTYDSLLPCITSNYEKLEQTGDSTLFPLHSLGTHIWKDFEELDKHSSKIKVESLVYKQVRNRKDGGRWLFIVSEEIPILLMKLHFLEYREDSEYVARQEQTIKVLEALSPLFSLSSFSLPVTEWKTERHPLGSAKLDSYFLLPGGSIANFIAEVDTGKMLEFGLHKALSHVGEALGEMHSATSSRLIAPLVHTEDYGIHHYWNDYKVRDSLESIQEQTGWDIDIESFLEQTKHLEAKQPSVSLVHGNLLLEHVVVNFNWDSYPSNTVRWCSLKGVGNYLFYNLVRHSDGATGYESIPTMMGAPEIDYFVFTEDLVWRLSEASFDEEEIAEFLFSFQQAYCVTYHRQFQSQCQFPEQDFSAYAKHIAKLIISVSSPLFFRSSFPLFIQD